MFVPILVKDITTYIYICYWTSENNTDWKQKCCGLNVLYQTISYTHARILNICHIQRVLEIILLKILLVSHATVTAIDWNHWAPGAWFFDLFLDYYLFYIFIQQYSWCSALLKHNYNLKSLWKITNIHSGLLNKEKVL